MKTSFTATMTSIVLLVTSAALAAPPAQATSEKPCAHCVAIGAMKIETANTRGAALNVGARPCRHLQATATRWGNAQKPCPHCSHSA